MIDNWKENAIRMFEDERFGIDALPGGLDQDVNSDLDCLCAATVAARYVPEVTISGIRTAFMLGVYYGQDQEAKNGRD